MAKGKGGFLGQDGLNAPNQATGVSATAGDASATISWTAPSDTGSSAITGYSVQSNNGDGTPQLNSYDLNGATQTSNEFSYTHLADIKGLFFKSDGTKLYTNSQGANTVYQYSLSTAWDITTASYDSVSFSTSSQNTASWGLHFKPDGTKMYTYGSGADKIFRYGLSTAWDLSTASYESQQFSFSSQDTGPVGVWFKTDDGTKMYMIGFNNRTVYQYSLSTGWDVSSASYSSTSFSASSQVVAPACVVFNDDGTRMFISCYNTEKIYQYNLSTAWDVSSASYSSYSIDMTSVDTNVRSVFFKDDGSKLYVNGDTNDKIYEFTTGQEAGSYPTSSPVTITGLTNGTSYTFNVWAINASGWSAPSEASDAVAPEAPYWAVIGPYNGNLDRFNISTLGNATDWGDMTTGSSNAGAVSSSTRAVIGGGFNTARMEYFSFASGGTGATFGNLNQNLTRIAGCGNSTRGVFCGGSQTGNDRNFLQYITIATTSNSTDFGDLTTVWNDACAASNSTRGIVSGNSAAVINYFTIATTGNAATFGNLSPEQDAGADCANSTRAVFALGDPSGGSGDTLQYVTIATTGNASDFGDLTTTRRARPGATCGGDRGVVCGGYSNALAGYQTSIDYFNISSTGNAADFGDLTAAFREAPGCGSNHGGLQ